MEEEIFEGHAADLPDVAGLFVDDELAFALGREGHGDFEHLIAFAAADENAFFGEGEDDGPAYVFGHVENGEVASRVFDGKFVRRILGPLGIASLDVLFDL
jgi:hypothetical protein